MTHGAEALARTIIGIIGNIISFSLFISPAPTFWRIIKKKSTEEFHPYPYLASVMNCVFWIFYGIPVVHPDSVLVVTINSVGLALELIYLCIFFIFTNKKIRITILLFLVSEIVFLAVIAVITLLCFHTHETRSMFVGIICDIFGIIMYASPLSIVRKVFKTKSVEFLPFWLCLAGFVNGVVWFTYAFLKTFDPYIAADPFSWYHCSTSTSASASASASAFTSAEIKVTTAPPPPPELKLPLFYLHLHRN
ncbi:Bidirectional sugar transporter SWEET7 [Abeliophyllum distichum]|uniref:Bidirectional sugar transporter SWEET n=1 Tax=Abeliophyllum distichum TaxID=126358 RepID=A0ABD1SII8_9LAMI